MPLQNLLPRISISITAVVIFDVRRFISSPFCRIEEEEGEWRVKLELLSTAIAVNVTPLTNDCKVEVSCNWHHDTYPREKQTEREREWVFNVCKAKGVKFNFRQIEKRNYHDGQFGLTRSEVGSFSMKKLFGDTESSLRLYYTEYYDQRR